MWLQNNPGLCGLVPACLINRIPDLSGTGLMDPRNLTSNPSGGLCDESPPSCLPEYGCRCANSQHAPAFSAFSSFEGGCLATYGICISV